MEEPSNIWGITKLYVKRDKYPIKVFLECQESSLKEIYGADLGVFIFDSFSYYHNEWCIDFCIYDEYVSNTRTLFSIMVKELNDLKGRVKFSTFSKRFKSLEELKTIIKEVIESRKDATFREVFAGV